MKIAPYFNHWASMDWAQHCEFAECKCYGYKDAAPKADGERILRANAADAQPRQLVCPPAAILSAIPRDIMRNTSATVIYTECDSGCDCEMYGEPQNNSFPFEFTDDDLTESDASDDEYQRKDASEDEDMMMTTSDDELDEYNVDGVFEMSLDEVMKITEVLERSEYWTATQNDQALAHTVAWQQTLEFLRGGLTEPNVPK